MLTMTALVLALTLGVEPQDTCPPPPPCPACPACPAPAPPPPPKQWTGSVGLGLVSVTGNARSVTASFAAAAEHKGERVILGGKAYATYGESRVDGTMQTSAENAGLFLRGDYRATPRFSTYLLAGVETDHPKSIEERYSQEAGLAYAWIDWAGGEHKLFLRSDLGFRIAEEYRYQYFPQPAHVTPREFYLKAPRIGAAFRWEANKSVLFTEDAEALPNLGSSRVFVNSVSKLSAKVFGPLAVGVGFTVNYDSDPPAKKVPWDTTLAVTLDYLL